MAAERSLRGWDLATWRLAEQDPSLGSSMLSVVELDGQVSLETLLSRVEWAAEADELLRSVVVRGDHGPSLRVATGLSASGQVRQLPPGTAITAAAAAALVRPFGYGELLWRLRVLHTPDTTVLIAVMNHAIADAMGAVRLLSLLFDGAKPVAPAASTLSAQEYTPELAPAVAALLLELLANPSAVAGRANELLRSAAAALGQFRGERPAAVNGRGGALRCAWLSAALSAVPGGAQHKAVAAGASAFASIAAQRGAALESISVNVPVARPRAGRNQIAAVRVRIGAGTLAEQQQESRAAVRAWLASPMLGLADEAAELAAALPLDLVRGGVQAADLTVTYLPEPLPVVSIAGTAVLRWRPLAPPVGAAANITLVRSARELVAGTTWDTAVLDDSWPEVLVERMSAAFDIPFTLTDD